MSFLWKLFVCSSHGKHKAQKAFLPPLRKSDARDCIGCCRDYTQAPCVKLHDHETSLCVECCFNDIKFRMKEAGVISYDKLTRCFDPKCEKRITAEDLIALHILPAEMVQKFRNFSARNDASFVVCQNCNFAHEMSACNNTGPTNCSSCKADFCASCGGVAWHANVSCDKYKKRSNAMDKEVEVLLRNRGFRQCPGCKEYVEKDEGCDHMYHCVNTHGKSCNTHFCYSCGTKLDATGLRDVFTNLPHYQSGTCPHFGYTVNLRNMY